MMRRFLAGGGALVLFLAVSAGVVRAPTSRTIYVDCTYVGFEDGSPSQPFDTIQEAITAAVDGDVVVVRPCTYNEPISFQGKAITVTSTDPLDPSVVAATVIEGGDPGRLVNFANGEGASSVLDGFTIAGTAFGVGGIYCYDASPTISNNVITGHAAAGNGGGIHCRHYSSPTITNNTIVGNLASDDGGGICCEDYSHATITDNVVTGNHAWFGSGIACSDFSSPAISNNIISGNTNATLGGGIYCFYSDAIISNNTISGNTAEIGSGICCHYPCSPTIANNNISGNSAMSAGGAMYCHMAYPTVTNNTITANSAQTGGGMRLDSASPTLSNNIVAFNSSGIYLSSGTPTLRDNCVYNPDGDDYWGLDPGAGDISQDPRLAAAAYGRLHIQPDSPCIDAGDDAAVDPGWVDMDGQARVQGAHVDIGADESDGTWWDSAPVIVRVSPLGDDENDGSDWGLAKLTVQSAIDAAAAQGGEVWVAAGTYYERITLCAHAYVYGGFAGTENDRGERDWTANTTILDGSAGGSVVTAKDFGYRLSAVDGFTIRNGSGSGSYGHYGGGICCVHASPIIMNNAITGNSAPGDSTAGRGGGIFCGYSLSAIANNTISGNGTDSGGGIYCSFSSPVISSNDITGNDAADYAGGIYSDSQSLPTISHNNISGNSTTYGGGIHCDGCSPTISNNSITGNTAAFGGAIGCDRSSSPTVTNNTIAGNSASDAGGGLYCDRLSSPAVSNNVLAFSSSGIHQNSGMSTLRNNCVYNPDGYDYSGLAAGEGDISADPLFVDFAGGDYHLTAGSPCVDAGWNDAPGIPDTDMDGQSRIQNGTVDIGADELTPICVDCTNVTGIEDGSPEHPYDTIQEGIGAAVDGDTVLVQPCIYYENIDFLGRAITVISTDPLDPAIVAATVIDGGGAGSVATFANGEGGGSVLRGFTIRNGIGSGYPGARWGGGIYCSASSPTITNNVITGNSAVAEQQGRGGGIYCGDDGAPYIANNVISNNVASLDGGGIVCTWESSPTIVNNTVSGNRAHAWGGGIHCHHLSLATITNNTVTGSEGDGAICCYDASPSISNNIVAFNSSGMSQWGISSPTLRNNCVYNPDGDDYSGLDPGEGDISADPLLVDVTGGDYHLTAGSPCIDAGWNEAPGLPGTDIDADPRPYPVDGLVDMGADEWVPSPLRLQLRGDSWHLITIPCDPTNTDPWEVFDELRPPNKSMDRLSGSLYRYDEATGSYMMYEHSAPEEFGTLTAGEGYWLWLFEDESLCYEAECSGEPQSIHFATPGWHMMGYPEPRHTYVDDTSWQYSTTGPYPFSTVTQPGDLLWVLDPLYCWSPSEKGYRACGLHSEEDDHLRAFKGYWLYTFEPDVTMVVPP